MTSFIAAWADYTWDMLLESSLLLLFGFVLAGLIRSLLTPQMLFKIFGQGRFKQILTASMVGVPLPLCSCSVLPVAAQLHRSGLSREGTISFLISTPETGVDSIALSVKLLGPLFAVVRPVAALITALFSGLMAALFIPGGDSQVAGLPVVNQPQTQPVPFWKRLWNGQVYVMTDMLPELAYYLFWGYALAGVAAALIPADLLKSGLSPWLQYVGVVAVGVPVYVCATSSTPLAAVFLSLGILPGAVLAFLLVGPATNLTALVVQKRILGLKGTVLMTISVVVTAVICGLALDALLGGSIISTFGVIGTEKTEGGWYNFAAAVFLSSVMVYYTSRHYYKKAKKKLAQK